MATGVISNLCGHLRLADIEQVDLVVARERAEKVGLGRVELDDVDALALLAAERRVGLGARVAQLVDERGVARAHGEVLPEQLGAEALRHLVDGERVDRHHRLGPRFTVGLVAEIPLVDDLVVAALRGEKR